MDARAALVGHIRLTMASYEEHGAARQTECLHSGSETGTARTCPACAGWTGLVAVGPSQRLQELDDGDLIALRQLPKAVGHIARFAAMPHDGVA